MEGSNGLPSNFKDPVYAGTQRLVSPFPFPHISAPSFDPSSLRSEGNSNPPEGVNHHRCISESFLIEEQPPWLEELLNEPDRGHRRSASDSYAYFGAAADEIDIKEDFDYKSLTDGSSLGPSFILSNKDLNHVTFEINPYSSDDKESNGVATTSAEMQTDEDFILHNQEESAERSCSETKNVSKTDAKRAKQHSAHRSRVRKLQYIAELERTVQVLQAEGSEISAELDFVDQQNLLLSMENKALRQRLDSLSQEQLIKNLEQDMLERELGRIQALYQLKREQQISMQQHHQKQQHSRPRRTRSRDFEPQLSNLSKNKDSSSSRGSVSAPSRA